MSKIKLEKARLEHLSFVLSSSWRPSCQNSAPTRSDSVPRRTFAVSPTRTVVSVSSNKKNQSGSNLLSKGMDPMSLQSMYDDDGPSNVDDRVSAHSVTSPSPGMFEFAANPEHGVLDGNEPLYTLDEEQNAQRVDVANSAKSALSQTYPPPSRRTYPTIVEDGYNYSDSELSSQAAIPHPEVDRLKMGLQSIADNQWQSALECLQSVVEDEGNRTFEALYGYARALRELGMLKKSAEIYQSALSVDGSHAQCYFESGNLLHRGMRSTNKVNKALHLYAKCLSLSKGTHHECLSECAVLLEKKKKLKEAEVHHKKAVAECQKVLEEQPDDVDLADLNRKLAEYHDKYGLFLRNLKRFDEANGQFQSAMAIDPQDTMFGANYAYSLFLNERYKESEDTIIRLLDEDPESGWINHIYALLLRRTNRFADSFQYHEKATQCEPENKEFKRKYDEFLEFSNRFSHDEKQRMKKKFDKCQQLIKAKNFEKARVMIKALAAANPFNIVYCFKYAFVLHRMKQYKEAERWYNKAFLVEGDHSICHFDMGLMLSKLKRYDEAKYHYSRCLHMNPSDWICHINYARLLEKRGNFKEAAFHLEKSLEINPNDAEAHQCYTQILKKLKQQRQWAKKSGDSFQSPSGQKRKPSAPQVSPWRKVSKVSAVKLKDTMSKQSHQRKQKRTPSKPTTTTKLSMKNVVAGNPPVRPSKSPMRNRVQSPPEVPSKAAFDPRARYNEAMELFSRGQYRAAKGIFAGLLEGHSDFEYLRGFARTLRMLKEYDVAETQYRRALEMKRDDDVLHFELGVILYELNRFTESGDYIVNALQLNAERAEYNYYYALILEALDDPRDALAYYQKCYALQPDFMNVAAKIEALSSSMQQMERDQAADSYHGDSAGVLVQVDQLMADKDYRGAKQLMYPMMEQAESAQNFRWSLKYAEILQELNELHEAEEWFKAALKVDPEYADCHFHLGMICAEHGRTQQALLYLEKCCALQPDNEVYRSKYNETVRNQQHKTSTASYSLFGGNALFGGSPLFGGGPVGSPSFSLFGSPDRKNSSAEFARSANGNGNRFYADLEQQHSGITAKGDSGDFEASTQSQGDDHRQQLGSGDGVHFQWENRGDAVAEAPGSGQVVEEEEDLSTELNLNSKAVEFDDSDVNYNSYLFSTPSTDITHSHIHHHRHIHQHVVSRTASSAAADDLDSAEIREPAQPEGAAVAANDAAYDEEKQYPMNGLNGIADDLFREVRAPRDLMAIDQDEKTREESQHQLNCEKQRRNEFRIFLLEKVQFTKMHFDRYWTKLSADGLADIRMLPYLDGATLSSVGMSKPHQKLMMQKMAGFERESRRFSSIVTMCSVPTKLVNVLHDFGISTVQSFIRNFRTKGDLQYLTDNVISDAMLDTLWTAVQNSKSSASAEYARYDTNSMPSEEGNAANQYSTM